jgi:lysyl-tRNA synthetase, class II
MELFVGGKEIVNSYVELNDPFDQMERFRNQVKVRLCALWWGVAFKLS